MQIEIVIYYTRDKAGRKTGGVRVGRCCAEFKPYVAVESEQGVVLVPRCDIHEVIYKPQSATGRSITIN